MFVYFGSSDRWVMTNGTLSPPLKTTPSVRVFRVKTYTHSGREPHSRNNIVLTPEGRVEPRFKIDSMDRCSPMAHPDGPLTMVTSLGCMILGPTTHCVISCVTTIYIATPAAISALCALLPPVRLVYRLRLVPSNVNRH